MELLKSENDFYTTVEKALDELDPEWRDYEGLIICGSHLPSNVEEKIEAIRKARENNIPFLGICMGMQLAVIEYARNVLGIKDATSSEFGTTGTVVIEKMPNLHIGIRKTWHNTIKSSYESYWHNYKVSNDIVSLLFKEFDGGFYDYSNSRDTLAWLKLKNHIFYYLTQFHPEYQSSKDRPHPLLLEFIKVCKEH